MNDSCGGGQDAGLCGHCAHVQVITSERGSRFYLCLLSKVDPRFPKYPPLPVRQCAGYVLSTPATDDRTR